MRKLLQLSFYVSTTLLLVLLLISFSPLELVYLEHQIIYWQLCFYGFVITSLISLCLMGSSGNILFKVASVPITIIVLTIIGIMLHSEKPLQTWRDAEVLPISENSFFENVVKQYKAGDAFSSYEEKHRVIKRRLLHKYLIWCVEI